MRTKKPNFLSALRRFDKIVLGLVALMVLATVVLNVLSRAGYTLINESAMLYLPIVALLVLLGWVAYALIRRIRSRVVRIAVGACMVLATLVVVLLGFTYLSFVTYTAMPHAYKTLADPDGKHELVVMWRFDDDAERNEASITARKAARLEAYPDSDPETLADDVTVAFSAYPKAWGPFYRSNADVEGSVYLAYTGNVADYNVIEPAEAEVEATAEAEATAEPEATAEAEDAEPAGEPEAVSVETADAQPTAEAEPAAEVEPAAEPTVILTPHGTMMLEWLEDNTVAHFFVKDPGTSEGGECTVRFN